MLTYVFAYENQINIVYTHYKEWNNAICSNMDGPKDYHVKQSKSERERQNTIYQLHKLKYNK